MGTDGSGKERIGAEPDDDVGAIEAQWRPNDLIQQEVIRTRRHAIQPGVAESQRAFSHRPKFGACREVVGPTPSVRTRSHEHCRVERLRLCVRVSTQCREGLPGRRGA